tara:strand:- start:25 stop:507 length:483 start_codon:yes stop_codon:yes gene_type:complete
MKNDFQSGKWQSPDVPKTGWSCNGIDDLSSKNRICEMCENRKIRWAHQMEHTNYPDILSVGCICAGKMEGDEKGAKQRENQKKNLSNRRRNWIKRKWSKSKKGNPFLNTDGFNIVCFQTSDGTWCFLLKNRTTGFEYKQGAFQTLQEAQLGAFDRMIESK